MVLRTNSSDDFIHSLTEKLHIFMVKVKPPFSMFKPHVLCGNNPFPCLNPHGHHLATSYSSRHHELWKEFQRIQRQAAVKTRGATCRKIVTCQPWNDGFGWQLEFHWPGDVHPNLRFYQLKLGSRMTSNKMGVDHQKVGFHHPEVSSLQRRSFGHLGLSGRQHLVKSTPD